LQARSLQAPSPSCWRKGGGCWLGPRHPLRQRSDTQLGALRDARDRSIPKVMARPAAASAMPAIASVSPAQARPILDSVSCAIGRSFAGSTVASASPDSGRGTGVASYTMGGYSLVGPSGILLMSNERCAAKMTGPGSLWRVCRPAGAAALVELIRWSTASRGRRSLTMGVM
jgi:hypothetical protein